MARSSVLTGEEGSIGQVHAKDRSGPEFVAMTVPKYVTAAGPRRILTAGFRGLGHVRTRLKIPVSLVRFRVQAQRTAKSAGLRCSSAGTARRTAHTIAAAASPSATRPRRPRGCFARTARREAPTASAAQSATERPEMDVTRKLVRASGGPQTRMENARKKAAVDAAIASVTAVRRRPSSSGAATCHPAARSANNKRNRALPSHTQNEIARTAPAPIASVARRPPDSERSARTNASSIAAMSSPSIA